MLLLLQQREHKLVAAVATAPTASRRIPPNKSEQNYTYKVARKRHLDEDPIEIFEGRPPRRTAAAVCDVLMGNIAYAEKNIVC